MDTLDTNQIKAALLIAWNRPAKYISKEIGVSPKTVAAWKQDPVFQACVHKLRLEIVETSKDRFDRALRKVFAGIERVAESPDSMTIKREAISEIIKGAGFENPELLLYGIGAKDGEDLKKQLGQA